MICKNCDKTLQTDYSFCPDCGAKVIKHRITIKSIFYDFFERFFNLDNTFFKTIGHMIIKPQDVCGGYISGLRKKYLNPLSMLAISLTLSGFILFFMKKVAWEYIDFSKISYAQTSSEGKSTEKIMSTTMEYGSLLYLLYIPIIAFASYIIFNKRKYNYPEHIIISIYALTTFSIFSTLYAIIALIVSPQFYIDTALTYTLLMILFCIYTAYRNMPYKTTSLLWRIPTYLFIVFIGYMGISMLTVIMLFLTGEISIEDLKTN